VIIFIIIIITTTNYYNLVVLFGKNIYKFSFKLNSRSWYCGLKIEFLLINFLICQSLRPCKLWKFVLKVYICE
jgi:hypothetical protein